MFYNHFTKYISVLPFELKRFFSLPFATMLFLVGCVEPSENSGLTKIDSSSQNNDNAEANVVIDTVVDKRAAILAGYELDALDSDGKEKAKLVRDNWNTTKSTILDPIRNWCVKEGIDSLHGDEFGVFYPFSGPDVPFVYSFYPGASVYIMAGLEKAGNKNSIIFSSNPDYGSFIKGAGSYFYFSGKLGFFRTADMGRQFTEKGVADIISFYLKINNCKIASVSLLKWDENTGTLTKPENDSASNVFHTTFIQPSGKLSEIFYFSRDLSDNALKKDSLWTKWVLNKFSSMKVASLTKSASYLMHNKSFSIVKNFILTNSGLHIQDDSGIDFNSILESKREYVLYGKYSKTIPLFRSMFEEKLKNEYTSDSTHALPFKIGYNVSHGESNLLVLKKPRS